MAAGQTDRLDADDARWTYRFLRIGMIGAVFLLAVSIWLEWRKAGCFQTSISAYYYTPVRAIFVGFLFAISLSLIVYKGRSYVEDLWLTLSGMLGPVVAVAPTTDVGPCWSVPPNPRPVMDDGSLANWVVTNIENNFLALMIAGIAGLIVSFFIALAINRRAQFRKDRLGTWIPLGVVAAVFGLGWWLSRNWGDFNTRAHGLAAVGMIVLLGFAMIAHAIHHWRGDSGRDKRLSRVYLGIAGAMALGGVFIWLTRIFGDHTVAALEAYEIGLFALYWIVQTKENWDVEGPSKTKPAAAELVPGPRGE